jgi:hypothetical protein
MRRLTLDLLSKFSSLAAFFSKRPEQLGGQGYAAHQHAFSQQATGNYGGGSILNIWDPSGDFTLSQQWYIGADYNQTCEVGWVHEPQRWGNTSVLFIYFTNNNYAPGSGCYNLDCAGFVQIDHSVALGTPLPEYSKFGDDQQEVQIIVELIEGDWWVYAFGKYVGYYPTSVYHGGFMASGAKYSTFGGETLAITDLNEWPQMGSGRWPQEGFKYAAYQRNISYVKTDGSRQEIWSTLKCSTEDSTCYNIVCTDYFDGSNWGSYFFYGGPGGKCPPISATTFPMV